MKTAMYTRRPLLVEAVQVTEENIYEVARWCDGEVRRPDEDIDSAWIKVRVFNPVDDKGGNAAIGSWILKSERGFKVYTQSAFEASFVQETPSRPIMTIERHNT